MLGGVVENDQWSYDVFLSFRGEDTRKGFVDHLYSLLHERGIHTFRDDVELERGNSISPKLKTAIERSRVVLVIFSENYANSSWCLDEITEIVECNKRGIGQTILPVFYKVDPSAVRKQTGSYSKAFEKHEGDPQVDKQKIQTWRDALQHAASVSGWHVPTAKEKTQEDDGQIQTSGVALVEEASPVADPPNVEPRADVHEGIIVREIAENLLSKLSYAISRAKAQLVGVESHVEKIVSMLDLKSTNDVRMIGIWGMGGIGKTTIARAVFDQVFCEFEGSCFLDNVREVSRTQRITFLEEKLVSDALRERKANLHNTTFMLRTRLSHKRVLVVLDDVNELEQLERLAGAHDWFGAGSRIIITTRDKRLLARHVDEKNKYEVSFLATDVALKLFTKFAFKEQFPKERFEKLAYDAVRYARGLPLVLKVLGSYLHGRDVDEWENALERLEEVPENSVFETLKVSFDALNDIEKSIFLDVACFYKGKKKEYVLTRLDSLGRRGRDGLNSLIGKALLTETHDNRLQMHNLLQEMGWYIVRRQHAKEPGRQSRLWLPEDICHVLTQNLGTEDIEGLHLVFTEPNGVNISSKAFENMRNLRLLRIRNAYIEKGPTYLPSDLQWLDWSRYPSRTLPQSFQGEKLVGLKLAQSQIENLGGLNKAQLNKLKFINLSYCKCLVKTPDFSRIPNLESLNLSNCRSLEQVHASLGSLKKLDLLNLAHCNKLKTLPRDIHLQSLKTLVLWDCVKLENFPQVTGEMPCLSELHLEGTAIKELPSSISKISGLLVINLSNCKNLTSLPVTICELKCLQTLNLSDCSKLENLPENLGEVNTLTELLVDGTAIIPPPPSIAYLENLKILSFSRCKRAKSWSSLLSVNLELSSVSSSISGILPLQKLGLTDSNRQRDSPLPPAPPYLSGLTSLKSLNLSCCDLLEEISANLGCLSSLEELDMSENKFVQFPAKISGLARLKILKLEGCKNLESLPNLPENIAILDADECHSLESLANLSGKHVFLWKMSFFNCFKLFKHQKNRNAGDQMLRSLLQGQHVIEGRFSVLFPGREVPAWFIWQKKGPSASIHLPADWHQNVIGFAVCVVFEKLVSKSKIGVTFELMSQGHSEFKAKIIPGAARLDDSSSHVWIGYISFRLFQLLFPLFQADDWAKMAGCECLTISTREEAWIKPGGCGVRPVYREDMGEAALHKFMDMTHEFEAFGQKSELSKEAEESISVLTYGVNQLNWSVDPIEDEDTQVLSLRNSIDFKVQKTLSFDY